MPTLLATAPLPGAPSPTLAPDGVSLPRLAALGGRTALHTVDGPVSYADLAARAADVVGLLPAGRSLVHVRASATVATVAQLVAARAAGHVVLLSAPGRPARSLAEAYDPDVVLAAEGVDVLRTTSAHDLHPELALLMSTSGSTGSPKLVRLSQRNLLANTAQVRAALGVRPTTTSRPSPCRSATATASPSCCRTSTPARPSSSRTAPSSTTASGSRRARPA